MHSTLYFLSHLSYKEFLRQEEKAKETKSVLFPEKLMWLSDYVFEDNSVIKQRKILFLKNKATSRQMMDFIKDFDGVIVSKKKST